MWGWASGGPGLGFRWAGVSFRWAGSEFPAGRGWASRGPPRTWACCVNDTSRPCTPWITRRARAAPPCPQHSKAWNLHRMAWLFHVSKAPSALEGTGAVTAAGSPGAGWLFHVRAPHLIMGCPGPESCNRALQSPVSGSVPGRPHGWPQSQPACPLPGPSAADP